MQYILLYFHLILFGLKQYTKSSEGELAMEREHHDSHHRGFLSSYMIAIGCRICLLMSLLVFSLKHVIEFVRFLNCKPVLRLTGSRNLKLVMHGSPVIGIAWNDGDNLLVSSDADGTVIV
ncbi:hypothetical protein Syun_007203 [Stephania yunnanensis]|uniref:Uncharacterized protein n=1 Tax=Stephania yunnanensis TaxID=152371 RepID=A0AAP0KZT2_9MAGN